MADFGEIDLYQRLAVVRAGTRQTMPLYQRSCRFWRDLEPFA
jgi:hypothetical protein